MRCTFGFSRSRCLILAFFAFCLFLCGCSLHLCLQIKDATDYFHPVFYFTAFNDNGQKYSPGSLTFREYDAKKYGKEVWSISGGGDVKEFTYGMIPTGYTERVKALPLETGKEYLVEPSLDTFIITRSENGVFVKIFRRRLLS